MGWQECIEGGVGGLLRPETESSGRKLALGRNGPRRDLFVVHHGAGCWSVLKHAGTDLYLSLLLTVYVFSFRYDLFLFIFSLCFTLPFYPFLPLFLRFFRHFARSLYCLFLSFFRHFFSRSFFVYFFLHSSFSISVFCILLWWL